MLEPEYRKAAAFKGIEEYSPSLAAVGIFRSETYQMGADSEATPSWWKSTQGSICYQIAISPKSHRADLCQTGRDSVGYTRRAGVDCVRNRYDGWVAGVRHQAISGLCGCLSGRKKWLWGKGKRPCTGSGISEKWLEMVEETKRLVQSRCASGSKTPYHNPCGADPIRLALPMLIYIYSRRR